MKLKFSIFSVFISLLLTLSYYAHGDDEDTKNILLIDFTSVADKNSGEVAAKKYGEAVTEKEQIFFKRAALFAEIRSAFKAKVSEIAQDRGIPEDKAKLCFYTQMPNRTFVELGSDDELSSNCFENEFIEAPLIAKGFDCNKLLVEGESHDRSLINDILSLVATVVADIIDLISKNS
ncbi:MAG: hypothetical protein PUP46_00770 [Endozoicomonas sp. (ex Botrylloides leachii)]|nr:hypothetical protein [Endozoicomonas sp. (ex Botrylloides leachii)]